MSKRKHKTPIQLNSSKRWLLTWIMNEDNQLGASTSHSAILTPLPLDTAEITVGPSRALASSTVCESVRSVEAGSETAGDEQSDCSAEAPRYHITRVQYEKIIRKQANYSITIHEESPQEKVLGHLGLVSLQLKPHQVLQASTVTASEPNIIHGDEDGNSQVRPPADLPKHIPTGKCSLFINSGRPHHLVFDYVLDDAENAPTGLSPTVYLMCLEAEFSDEPSEDCLDALESLCRHHKSRVRLMRGSYNAKTGQLQVSICLLQQALSSHKFASEPNIRKFDYARNMQSLMHWLHGYPAPAPEELPTYHRHDFNQLFDAVRRHHSRTGQQGHNGDCRAFTPAVQLQHPCLVPRLREYQRQAVSWMLHKERFGQERQGTEQEDENDGQLHSLWSEVALADQTLYYNYNSGQFTKQRFTRQPSFPGGILADEMGLGKTVEVLACILAHPRYPSASSFKQSEKSPQDVMDTSTGPALPRTDQGTQPTETGVEDESKESVVVADVEAQNLGVGPKPLEMELELQDQTSSSKHEEQSSNWQGVRTEGSEVLSEKTSLHCDIIKTDPQPVPQDHTSGFKSAISKENAEMQLLGLSESKKAEEDPGSVSSEATATSLDNTTYLLPATSKNQKPPTVDGLKPESVSFATDSLAGKSEDISRETRDLETCIKPEGHLSDHQDKVKLKSDEDESASLSTLVEETGNNSGSSLDGHCSNHLSTSSSPTNSEPLSVTAQPTEDSVEPLKKTKKKQTPRCPQPNPYLRLKSREPPKYRLECICGVQDEELDLDRSIQCHKCSGWQHCKCVNYTLREQSPGNAGYLCPMCCVEQAAVPSRATLIISPTSICHQWIDEINRHIQTQTLNILVYRGVKVHGFLQPMMLADHDIVITTYDTLRTELNYVDLPHCNSESGRRLRHAKRYMAVPSPLPAVEWWRVCLDEAQMVECPTAKVAEMALRLTAVNRWCVTGTPIQRDLDNLYGLFLFLGVEPYWVKPWWDNMLYKPYLRGNQEPMEKALADVLWRSAKKDVIHQINIPAQTEQIHWLQFSPVETHFYKRKQDHCSKDFLHVAGRLKMDVKTRLSSLARDTVNRLMNPLLRLRQACCHPQAVRGEFVSMQQMTLTMSELLQSLTLKAKTESEEAHRQLVCALNGLAGVCIIKGQVLDAIQFYRDVLHSAEEHKDRLKTDSLQRLHAMHNLHQLLMLKPEGVVPTLRDSELDKQVQEMRDAYLAKAEAGLQSSLDNLLPLQNKITQLQAKLSPQSPWWLDGLQWLRYLGVDEEFVDKIKNELTSTTHVDNMSISNHFSTLHGLQMVLVTKTEELDDAYKYLQAGMARLNVPVTPEMVAEATDCHLRPFGGKPKNRCPFCRVHTLFTEYETCLFAIKQRDILTDTSSDDDGNTTTGPRLQGSWGASETERILRALLATLRLQGGDDDVIQEGVAYLEMMDAQKREFKSMRVTWTMLCERVAAWDELKMATMRLRLREAHEPEEITSQANIIEPGELDQQRFKLLNDRVLAQSELKKKLGQLVYLRSLAAAQSDLLDGNNPDPCPICVRELGRQWTVLPCGHSFCSNCIEMMRNHRGSQHNKTLRCAICRSVCSVREISYVSTEPTNQPEESTIPVQGGYSTKVEAVVRTLLHLRQQDPNVKAIVFSTWLDVLTVIAKALRDNHIECRSIGPPGDRHFKENLMDFKHKEGVTALLLPVHSGSKGLNIIEATHVLLIEPILNPASELQAVGRVHRIGQTRPTFVHRFLVRDTIEERLHAFLQANHTSDSLNNLEGETGSLTLEDLKQLFTSESWAPDDAPAAESYHP